MRLLRRARPLVDGLISDCGRMVAERKDEEGWLNVSTLKEPFRVEGKKTMGYEVAEQLGWKLPQGIIYPTGGGVGMIGMWKAFDEMEELGWIGSERPRMITVQAAGCAPIVKAWEAGKSASEMWAGAATFAAGLRVPKAYGDYLILEIFKKSRGAAVAATDEEILAATRPGLAWRACSPHPKEPHHSLPIGSCAPAASSARKTRLCSSIRARPTSIST